MTHHVSVYVSPSCSLSVLPSQVQTPGTDVAHFVFETFNIAAARAVIDQAHQAPLESTYRLHILVGRRFTHEAQNALLKILEDPPVTARFILVVPSQAHLLPTVRSRVVFVDTSTDPVPPTAEEFLAENIAARLARIQRYQKAKDTNALRDIIQAVGQYIVTVPPETPWCTAVVRRTVEQAVRYSAGSGASQKMLCEHVALVVPIVTTR